MIAMAVISLLLGIACGALFFSPETLSLLGMVSGYALNLLMFSVGVSVGANKLILRHLRENSLTVLIVPTAIVASSLLGGWVTGLIFGMEPGVSMAIASGLGWYSLAGVMMTELAGAQIGAITFLANVFREILSFFIIPLIARKLNFYAAIAPAASTSEDTTLAVIMRSTNEQTTVVALLNGVILSLAVPFLIELTYHLGELL